MNKKFTIKSILLATLWLAIGSGTIVLLLAAIHKKDAQHCSDIYIDITGVSNNFFVDKKDIIQTIQLIAGGDPVGREVGSFNLNEIETELQKNTWIKNAQLFFDNNEVLQVKVLEREPVARVFTEGGTTFYLDSSLAMLPLSEKFSARLPVFTNFPSDKKVLLKADSNLLADILTVSAAIQSDSFLMAMIDQVDITPQRGFELVPKFGNTIIVFGDATNIAEKFKKLEIFYKEVIVKAGWNKYNIVNVQFKGQVVASRKGAADVSADSLRTLQLMKAIAENAERMSADSLQVIMQDNERNTTNSNLIQASIERDDNSAPNTIEKPEPQEPVLVAPISRPAPVTVTKPKAVAKKPASSPVKKSPPKPVVKKSKPVIKTKPAAGKTPKAVMPKPLPKKSATSKPANEY